MSSDLFGDRPATGRKSTPSKAKRSGPPAVVTAAMTTWHDAHVARFGCKPLIVGARDGRLFKDLAAAVGDQLLLDLIPVFFASRDWRILGSGYTVPDFKLAVPKLRLAHLAHHHTERVSPRTAANLDAADRATRKRD